MQDDIYGERRRTYIKNLTKKYKSNKPLLITIVTVALALAMSVQIANAIMSTFNDKIIQWGVEVLETPTYRTEKAHAEEVAPTPKPEPKHIVKTVHVTAYNTVPEQTDSRPCEAASGKNICGRDDVVACTRNLPFGTKVEIDGKLYVCEDRLAMKYDTRIDISCDKDMKCPFEIGSGTKQVKIFY